jgi:hypothetical protein
VRQVAVIATVAVGLVAGGCSGGSDDAANTNSVTVAPTDVTATIASSTSTSTSSSVAPTTTIAPTTTVDPTEALIAEIEADLNEGEQVFLAGAADPASPTNREALEKYFSDSALKQQIDFYDQLVANGLRARPGTEVASTIKVLEVVDASPDRVTAVICRIDAGVTYQISADGSEVVFDDSITRYDTRLEFRLVNGIWVTPGSGERIQERSEVTTCD